MAGGVGMVLAVYTMAIRADKSHLGEESSTRRFGITAVMSDLLGAGLLLVPPAVGTVNGGALLRCC